MGWCLTIERGLSQGRGCEGFFSSGGDELVLKGVTELAEKAWLKFESGWLGSGSA